MRPRCPRCGESARYVRVTARVTCTLTDDGEIGWIVKDAVGGTAGSVKNATDHEYVCGGNHAWKLGAGDAEVSA